MKKEEYELSFCSSKPGDHVVKRFIIRWYNYGIPLFYRANGNVLIFGRAETVRIIWN